MQAASYLKYTVAVLTNVFTCVTLLSSGIVSLKENVGALYEYLRAMVSCKVSLLFVPQVDLSNILIKLKHNMRTNSSLELPDDTKINIWTYFSIMGVTSVVKDDLVILTTPLTNRSLQIDL